MTKGTFCDMHKDEASSLIRNDKPVYDIRISRKTPTLNKKTNKQETWTQDLNVISACHTDVMENILKRAEALGIELNWGQRYKLINVNGKFGRILHPDDMTDEQKAIAEKVEPE